MDLAIIGCGLIGHKRAEAWAAQGLRVAAAYDRDFGKAQALCGRFGGEPCRDLGAALASGAGVANVAVSHDCLAPLALEALRAGKHLLLEKPGARSFGELEPVAKEAKARGLRVKVGYNHRFHPSFRKARELCDSGALGPLLYVRGRYGHGGRPGYEKEWRLRPEVSGGGELLDQGSHLIDLAMWFLGGIEEARGELPGYFWDAPVEDNAFLLLRAASGGCALLHASWTEWKNTFSFEITGRDGKLEVTGLGGSYGTEQLAFYRMLPQMGPPETTIWQYPFRDLSWGLEAGEFLRAIREGRDPEGGIDEALGVLAVIGDIYAQAGRKGGKGI
jgi:predicted dehydrogenase